MGGGGRPISAHVHWRSIIGGGGAISALVHWRSIIGEGAANICTCTLEEYNWGGNICTCTLEEYNWGGGAISLHCTLEEYNWGEGAENFQILLNYLTHDEYPNSNVGTPVFDKHIRDETAKENTERATSQRYPRHKVIDLIFQTSCFEKYLSVVCPHIAASIPDSSGNTQHEHTGEKERLEEERKSRQETWLLFTLSLFNFNVFGTFGLPHSDKNDRSHSYTCINKYNIHTKQITTVCH